MSASRAGPARRLASDASTRTLRRWLSGLGYPVQGWSLGLTRGPRLAVVEGMRALLHRLADEHGGPLGQHRSRVWIEHPIAAGSMSRDPRAVRA